MRTASMMARTALMFTLFHTATAYAGSEGDIRGIVKSPSKAVIAADITARITAMPFKPGMRFNRGARLVTFDCARLRAELKAMRAAESAKKQSFESKSELARHNAAGTYEVDIARAELSQASAEAQAISSQLSQCVVRAPFHGRVTEAFVNANETPAANTPLLSVLDDRGLEIEMIAPSLWLKWLESGAPFQFKIDETGETVSAKVIRTGAEIDPVSRTLQVTGQFINGQEKVLPGMSGTATFEMPAAELPKLGAVQ